MKIRQKNYSILDLDVTNGEFEIRQYLDYIVIEKKSIPELLKFIKENYNL